MEDKELDRLFREAFIKAEENPRDEVWIKIENKLETSTPIVPIRKWTKWWASAAATIAVSLGVYYTIEKAEDRPKIQLTSNTTTINTPRADSISNITITPLAIAKNNEYTERNRQETPNQDSAPKDTLTLGQPIHIEAIEEQKLIANLELEKTTSQLPLIRQVTEIDDIKPLVEFEEENESMLASTQTKERKNIITSLLNTLTDNVEQKINKEIQFHSDEEGSFSISILNSIAKNPNKKRK